MQTECAVCCVCVCVCVCAVCVGVIYGTVCVRWLCAVKCVFVYLCVYELIHTAVL